MFSTVGVKDTIADIGELIAPQGRLGVINRESADFTPVIAKCISIHWELMFARALFQTADMDAQHKILDEVARPRRCQAHPHHHDAENYGRISAENLKKAHAFVETGKALGKVVLEGVWRVPEKVREPVFDRITRGENQVDGPGRRLLNLPES